MHGVVTYLLCQACNAVAEPTGGPPSSSCSVTQGLQLTLQCVHLGHSKESQTHMFVRVRISYQNS